MWDPATYLRYGDERARPFTDLLARVGAAHPRAVVDLGCGPGHLTLTLARRWPGARVLGLDAAPQMVRQAQGQHAPPTVRFAVADARDWAPGPDVDVLVCNAVLHWVPAHETLLARWARQLPAGAWLAIQVPANFDAPSHRAMRAVAAEPGWAPAGGASARLAEAVAPRTVPDLGRYAELLLGAGCAVDAWETTYLHLLPASGPEHPVLDWMEGTALRPVRAVLGDADWAAFRQRLAARLAQAYPVAGGRVLFPFRRLFAVARTGPADR